MSDICADGLPGRAFRHAGALPFRFPCDPDAGSRRRGPAPSPSLRLSFCRFFSPSGSSHPFLSLPHKNHNSRSILLLLIIRRLLCCFAENTSLCLPSSQKSSLPSQLLLCGCAGTRLQDKAGRYGTVHWGRKISASSLAGDITYVERRYVMDSEETAATGQ